MQMKLVSFRAKNIVKNNEILVAYLKCSNQSAVISIFNNYVFYNIYNISYNIRMILGNVIMKMAIRK